MTVGVSRALDSLLGHLADRRFGDPRRGHPVALFGSAACRPREADVRRLAGARRRPPGPPGRDRRGGRSRPGARGRGTTPSPTRSSPPPRRGPSSAARRSRREARAVHDLLAADDLPGARQRLTHLVGRDTSVLDEAEVSRAVVESVAENTSDAVVAPLVWGALLGVPGLLGYRAANTLDAMVGHRGERYGRFGWASARFDDLLNLPGARLSGLLAAALAPAGRRPTVGRAPGLAARRPAPPQPQRGRRRGRLRRRARRTARGSQPLRPRHRGPRASSATARRRPRGHRPGRPAGRRRRHRSRRRGRARRVAVGSLVDAQAMVRGEARTLSGRRRRDQCLRV